MAAFEQPHICGSRLTGTRGEESAGPWAALTTRAALTHLPRGTQALCLQLNPCRGQGPFEVGFCFTLDYLFSKRGFK